jgi:xanthine dehydrogenase YagT iron-sulfur-binding subunit
MGDFEVSRRGFLGGSAAAVGGLSAVRHARAAEPPAPTRTPDMIDIVLEVNGRRHPLNIEPRVSLLDALREALRLTGTKKGCDRGSCGACTVHVDGRRVLSCLTLAARCQGKAVTTIEGLARDGELHPMQAAFLAHDGFQCGYCTPGQIMSAVGLVEEGRALSDDAIREWMSGNICRCGAYPNILAAIKQAVGEG